jgi:hypothetical protein
MTSSTFMIFYNTMFMLRATTFLFSPEISSEIQTCVFNYFMIFLLECLTVFPNLTYQNLTSWVFRLWYLYHPPLSPSQLLLQSSPAPWITVFPFLLLSQTNKQTNQPTCLYLSLTFLLHTLFLSVQASIKNEP